MSDKQIAIRNSTAEFLIYTSQSSKETIEVRYQDENVWLSKKLIAKLYECSIDNIALHLKNIFQENELDENSVAEDYSVTASDGKKYKTKQYSLEAIIAIGYRVNSRKATQFRKWATSVLKKFSIKGYVLDKERLKNGNFLGVKFFDDLLEEIREIRSSERMFYQKISDIFATALDYDPNALLTKEFFATVQNKLHYSIHGNTAAEVIANRADSNKNHMGLNTWRKAPIGKILKTDVIIAKNYLDKEEMLSLERIVSLYLDFAEDQARRMIPMTMQDWKIRLDEFLKFSRREILKNPGKVSMEIAQSFAESEFEKYRIIQDKLFESDFDRFVKEIGSGSKTKKK